MEDRSTIEATAEPVTDGRGAGVTADPDSLLGDKPRSSFEHRRIVGMARQRLFRRSPSVHIGRYAIERRLGAGGMGEVYLGHDAALERRVAIKRVRAGYAREHAQERLRREARALARLSHPNVVQVYEVGEHEGQTFVAMEYVDGRTLTRWLAEQEPSWRQILEVFVAAGQGVAAAHDAGIVHRDFKPDNVLLSDDGGVRVVDFGLALSTEDALRPLRTPDAPQSIDERLSLAGTIIGTIRYMSFEQLCGKDVDARSDQFSYCLTLYEALWGESPFSLASTLARLSALEAAKPAPPRSRAGVRVPGRLWRIIRRGLSKDPSERWPDMHALLASLGAVLHRRRRWGIGLSAAAIIVAGGMTMGRPALPDDPCAHVEHELDGVWDDGRRDALASKAKTLEAEHVADSHERIVAGLDRWSTEWLESRRRSCEGEAERRVEPAQSREAAACLLRQRQRVADLVQQLLRPEAHADVMGRAIDAVAAVPAPGACEDALALLGLDPPNPSIATRVESARRDLDRAHQLRLLGRVEDALSLADETERAARALDYAPLLAEAAAERARAELRAGSLSDAMAKLQEAIDLAELSRHDRLVADLWLELAQRTLTSLADEEAGAARLHRAEIAHERVGVSPAARARLVASAARLATSSGDPGEAQRLYRQAIEHARSDASSVRLVGVFQANLARLLRSQGAADEALSLQEDAVAATESYYGPHHPQTARRLYDLAGMVQRSEPDRARDLLDRVVSIWSAAHSRPHEELARAHFILAQYALGARDVDEAVRHAQAVTSIQAQVLPEDDVAHAHGARLWAKLHAIRGEYEQALEQGLRAQHRLMPERGERDADMQQLWNDNVGMLLALGRLDEASDQLDQLLPLAQTLPAEGVVRLNRCELALRRGLVEQARLQLDLVDACESSSCDVELHGVPRAILRAIIDMRTDASPAAALEELSEAMKTTVFHRDQLTTWFERLEPTPAERARIAPHINE